MDPRIARSHASVLQAATALLVEGGPDALTVDGVVARSGVAKSTVYRHWATRDDLVADVIRECAPHVEPLPEGLAFEAALQELTRRLVAAMGDPKWRRMIPALLLLRLQHSDVAQIDEQLKDDQHDLFATVLRLGVDEGRLDSGVLEDVDRVMALLVGPVLMAALVDSAPLNDEFADEVAGQFLAASRQRV